MGRGKIEMKRIENSVNRQVTYSKRRRGIMKKAEELTVLCDAQVSLIMCSSTEFFSDYCSPSTTTKKIFDRYQQASGINLWGSQYGKIKEYMEKLKVNNEKLRKEIRQRTGEELNGLNINELRHLEQTVELSLKTIRDRKFHIISTQTNTYNNRVKGLERAQAELIRTWVENGQNQHYEMHDQDQQYESALVPPYGGEHLYAFCLEPIQPNLHDNGYGPHELRLG
uniref:Transcription factor AP3 n=1 Tax=Hedyosmum orientale TaxID=226581 RepID=I7EGM0_9MAGN|nr:transcription factor AP3 [Hedyosmum orientale]